MPTSISAWNLRAVTASDEWLEHLTRERRPPNTIAAARRVMRSLPNASTATREDVEAWWASRAHLSPATRSNDIAMLRSFYDWAIRWEHRTDDPTRRIDAPRVPQGLPRPMSRADLDKLLATLEPDMRRAVALGAYAGLRVSEAAGLDWDDIDLETNRIRVTGKGAKTRAVGLSVLLLDVLLPNTGGNVVTAGGAPYSAGNCNGRSTAPLRPRGSRRRSTSSGTGSGPWPTSAPGSWRCPGRWGTRPLRRRRCTRRRRTRTST